MLVCWEGGWRVEGDEVSREWEARGTCVASIASMLGNDVKPPTPPITFALVLAYHIIFIIFLALSASYHDYS